MESDLGKLDKDQGNSYGYRTFHTWLSLDKSIFVVLFYKYIFVHLSCVHNFFLGSQEISSKVWTLEARVCT